MSAGSAPVYGRFSITGLAICLLLLAVTFLAYIPVTHFYFIDFDDPAYVVYNPHVTGGFTWSNIAWAFTSFDPDNWFPLTRLSHMLDYALFGADAFWHHAVSIFVHALASVMLYLFLNRATRQRWPAAFVAAVFALHPMHVQSVAWIAERKDVLCAFFWFATLWAWVRYRQRPAKTGYGAALLLFAAGLMSKPMIVTLPLLLPLLEIWPLRQPVTRRLIFRILPFAGLSAMAAILALLSQRASGATRALDVISFVQRLENALLTPFIYIGKTFWPTDLSIVYPWPSSEPVWLTTLAALGIAGISILVLMLRRDRPYLVTGWFWFLITLLPVIGLVQIGPQARADRYMYVPMVGLLIIVAWGVTDLVGRVGSRRRWAIPVTAALAIAVCLSLGIAARSEEQYWDSAPSLFRHATAIDDQNYLAWEYLGASLDLNTELPAKLECYQIALRIRPDFPDLHANFGGALLQAGRIPESLSELQTALRIRPRDSAIRCLMGAALLRADRTNDAVSQFEIAVRDDPDSAMAHNDLAVALWKMPEANKQEAERQLREAVALHPDYSLPHSNLGFVLLETPGGVTDAVSQFVQALGIYPDDAGAHAGLSRALVMKPFSDPGSAQSHLSTARRLVPDPEIFQRFETLRLDYGEHR